jgi:hypothetical protein
MKYARVVLLAMVATAVFGSSAAAEVRIPRLSEPEIEILVPELRSIHIPPPVIHDVITSTKTTYGTGDVTIERDLAIATNGHVQALDDDGSRFGETLAQANRRCVSKGLRGVAADYKNAIANTWLGEAPQWPSFKSDFENYVSACLAAAFPSAPQWAVSEVSSYLGDQAGQFVAEALDSESSAEVLAQWLGVTALDVQFNIKETVPAGDTGISVGRGSGIPEPQSPPSHDKTDDTPVVGIAVVIGIAVSIGLWAFTRRRKV